MKIQFLNKDFWTFYMPPFQLATLDTISQKNPKEWKKLFPKVDKIGNVIQNMPTYWEIADKSAEDIKVGLHYFDVANGSDWYVTCTNLEKYWEEPSFGFVCLNKMYHFAELGNVRIPNIIQNEGFVELDLDWNPNTSLREVMNQYKKLAGEN